MGSVILKRMPVSTAGAITRSQDLTAEPVQLKSDNSFKSYGLVGKRVNGYFVPLTTADSASAFAGFYIRPYPTTSTPDQVRQVGAVSNMIGDRLRRGYMGVNVGGSAVTISAGAPVHVRIDKGTESSPLGSVLAAAVATETAIYPNAFFTGPGDADGNAEIEFNI
jgi:hypothetical protein